MNYSDHDIEAALRAAPQPKAPASLEQELLAQLPSFRNSNGQYRRSPAGTWLRRWWAALAPAAVSVACAAVITAQQFEIRDLKQSLKASSPLDSASESATIPVIYSKNPASNDSPAVAPQDEIQRLTELARKLTAEVMRLQNLRVENNKLRAQLAAPGPGDLTPEEIADLQKGKEKANSIACVNNLKQIGLALHVWAMDNEEAYPPNFLVMSNELSTPKLLVCPSDTSRPVARDFSSFEPANCSYEYFAPVGEEKPIFSQQRVMVRCPVHGNIALADGSVQREAMKNHPDWFVERDGKLFFEAPARKPEPGPQPEPNQ